MTAHFPPYEGVDNGDSCTPSLERSHHAVVSDGSSTSYYELPEETKEIQDLIEHKNMNFAIGNIFKACYRIGEKAGQDNLYDLNKIIWFAEREKRRLEGGV